MFNKFQFYNDIIIAAPQATNPASFITPPIHNLSTAPLPSSIVSYFSDFISNDNTLDSDVKRQYGHIITNVVNTTTFEIANLDFSTPSYVLPAYSTLFIGYRRISFQFRLRQIMPNHTNYITPF